MSPTKNGKEINQEWPSIHVPIQIHHHPPCAACLLDGASVQSIRPVMVYIQSSWKKKLVTKIQVLTPRRRRRRKSHTHMHKHTQRTRGVRKGGRDAAERGPSSSPLLLLFCCFSATPSLAGWLGLCGSIIKPSSSLKFLKYP